MSSHCLFVYATKTSWNHYQQCLFCLQIFNTKTGHESQCSFKCIDNFCIDSVSGRFNNNKIVKALKIQKNTKYFSFGWGRKRNCNPSQSVLVKALSLSRFSMMSWWECFVTKSFVTFIFNPYCFRTVRVIWICTYRHAETQVFATELSTASISILSFILHIKLSLDWKQYEVNCLYLIDSFEVTAFHLTNLKYWVEIGY